MSNNIHVCGNIPVKEKCKYYRWPSCHPAQTGDEDIYVCVHPAQKDDFSNIVNCLGDHDKCELGERAKYYRRGLKVRISNAKKNIESWEQAIKELEEITGTGIPNNQ